MSEEQKRVLLLAINLARASGLAEGIGLQDTADWLYDKANVLFRSVLRECEGDE